MERLETALDRLEGLDPNERREAMDRLDPALRSIVEAFLSSEAEADGIGFLDPSSRRGLEIDAAPPSEGASHDALGTIEPLGSGARVGAYRLEEVIGEGGSSIVYRAQRADDAYSQQVAVKVLRREVGGERRFRAERQLLAELEHPSIARLLDGGMTPDGTQYLVMDFVRGRPLDRFCDERKMSIEERLELLVEVCEIVAWAHRHLVVHRDLKPSNILVTDDGRPRLLDFGIAKLLEGRQTGAAARAQVVTSPWVRLLTPGYASPEQVRGEPPSAANDVYSLGVLLHQSLTGRLPYEVAERDDAAGRSRLEALERRQLRPLALPSRRVGPGSGEDPAETRRLAALRGATPGELSRRLRGDLDEIVRRALHPDLERRYSSAQHLADDLRRHLGGHPVTARPDALSYRLGKVLRRHPRVSAFATLAVLALIAATIALGIAAARLEAERDLARAERDAKGRLVTFLRDLWVQADPWAPLDGAPTVLSLLDEGRDGLAAFDAEPLIQVPLLVTLGRTYVEHGETDRGAPLLERAAAIFERTPPADRDLEAEAWTALGIARRAEGRLDDAAALHRRALAIHRAADPQSPLVASSLTNLAVVLHRQGQPDRAIERLHEALGIYEGRATGESLEEDIDRSITWSNLAATLVTKEQFDEARQAIDRALTLRRDMLPADHPLIAAGLSHSAMIEYKSGRPAEAEATLRDVLAIYERRLGFDHPETLRNVGGLALALDGQGRPEEAESVWRDLEERARRAHGDEHPLVDWVVQRGQRNPSEKENEGP